MQSIGTSAVSNASAATAKRERERSFCARHTTNGMIVWTASGARNGIEIVYGDVLLDRASVVAVGYIPPSLLDGVRQQCHGTADMRVEDLGGAWVTPGLVDLHSHRSYECAMFEWSLIAERSSTSKVIEPP